MTSPNNQMLDVIMDLKAQTSVTFQRLDDYMDAQDKRYEHQNVVNEDVQKRLSATEHSCSQSVKDIQEVKTAVDKSNKEIGDLKTATSNGFAEMNKNFKSTVDELERHHRERMRLWISVAALCFTVFGLILGLYYSLKGG